MGDMADHLNEIGEDQWIRHLNGECIDLCPYCDDEEKELNHGT